MHLIEKFACKNFIVSELSTAMHLVSSLVSLYEELKHDNVTTELKKLHTTYNELFDSEITSDKLAEICIAISLSVGLIVQGIEALMKDKTKAATICAYLNEFGRHMEGWAVIIKANPF